MVAVSLLMKGASKTNDVKIHSLRQSIISPLKKGDGKLFASRWLIRKSFNSKSQSCFIFCYVPHCWSAQSSVLYRFDSETRNKAKYVLEGKLNPKIGIHLRKI